MCCGAPLPEKKSEERAKQNDGRAGHSGGCCGFGGEAGNRKYQLIGFLVYFSVVIAIIWFLPHRPIP